MRFIILPEAEDDMNAAAAYLARERGIGAARAFLQDILRSQNYIAKFPNGGKNEGDGIQSWKLRKYP
mgnify:CR=1 FL=1